MESFNSGLGAQTKIASALFSGLASAKKSLYDSKPNMHLMQGKLQHVSQYKYTEDEPIYIWLKWLWVEFYVKHW